MSSPQSPPVSADKEYDVFLCHNGADKDWVLDLAAQIESETIDGLAASRKLRVFVDAWDIDSGENLVLRMAHGLANSRYVASVLSPEFMKAPWTAFEWTHVVCDDPINASKRLIPLMRRDVNLAGTERIELVPPFKGLKYIDFRHKLKFKKGFLELIRRLRNLPPERGPRKAPLAMASGTVPIFSGSDEAWKPDQVQDAIFGNLLPLISLPRVIFSAETQARKGEEIWTKVDNTEPFLLKDKRIYTFANLNDKNVKLRAAISDINTVRQESRNEWLLNEDRSRWLINLLGISLTQHLGKLRIRRDKSGTYFFRAIEGQSVRTWNNSGDRPRTVAAEKTTKTSEKFWVHHAASIRFKRLGNRIFLLIEPTYFFTTNGTNAIEGERAGKLVRMWAGRQRNIDSLRNVIFWAKSIARVPAADGKMKQSSTTRLETGGEPILIESIPAIAKMNCGILDDEVRIGSLLTQVDNSLEKVAEETNLDDDSVTLEEYEGDEDGDNVEGED